MADVDLSSYVNARSPFGPIKSEDLDTENGRSAFAALYSPGNEIHRRVAVLQPNCLFGRKGAGKTAFLLGQASQRDALIVRFSQADLFSHLSNVVSIGDERHYTLLSEHVGTLWKSVMQLGVAHRAVTSSGDHEDNQLRRQMWQFFTGFAGELTEHGDPLKLTPDQIASETLVLFRRRIEDGAVPAVPADLLELLVFGGVSFSEVTQAAASLLEQRGRSALVLVDSIEDLAPHLTRLAEVIRGLLHLLAEELEPRYRFRLFVCMPSEITDHLAVLSSNPAKTMQKSIYIQWTSRELIRMAAHRFRIYLRLYHPDEAARLLTIGPDSGDDFLSSRRLLERFLPPTVTNGQGRSEVTLAYIMRHTQLLPRQLLQYLNRIWVNQAAEETENALSVTELAVITGVQDSESSLVQDILSAYYGQYPLARQILEDLVPYMTMRMSVLEIENLIRARGVHRSAGMEINDVVAMLVNIGALGKHVGQTSLYESAEFSFTFPKRLRLHDDEDACVHPIFAQYFETMEVRARDLEGHRAIYPYGSDPDATDYRRIWQPA